MEREKEAFFGAKHQDRKMNFGPANNGVTFSAITPHFFTVVLQNTLRDNRLLIPIKFVKKYGETLSNPVFVKLPCGSEWKMELRKSDGRVCLQKGWPDFVKHYSIALGHFLVFRYEGNSRFHAFIFDKSTVEIDYPLLPVTSDKPNGGGIEDDDSVEILEDFSPCPGKRKSSPSTCSQPHKKLRVSPIGKTEAKGAQSNDKMLGNSLENIGDLQYSKSMRGKFEVSAKNGDHGHKSIMPRWRKSEVENSTCKVIIRPSHVDPHYDMGLPRAFASEIFKNQSRDAADILSDGRTWPVNFSCPRHGEMRRGPRFGKKGWEKFARDNNLEAGDTCVFELIDGNQISLKVTILKTDSDSHPSQAGECRSNLLKPKRNVNVIKTKSLTRKHQVGTGALELVELGHGQVTCIPKFSGDAGAIVAASRFSSKYPFFEKTMTPSCLRSQRIPVDFGRTYFGRKTQTITLRMGKNSWSVTMIYNAPCFYGFSGGWSRFARENSLRAGDVCLYELIKVNDILLKVTVFRRSLHIDDEQQ